MKRRVRLFVMLTAAWSVSIASPGAEVNGVRIGIGRSATGDTERVSYVTRLDKDEGEIQERVVMSMSLTSNRVVTLYSSAYRDGTDQARIALTREGRLVDAVRTVTDKRGRILSTSRIWRDSKHVYSELIRRGRRKVKSRELNGLDVVADAGLLVRLRAFPFDAGHPFDILMASFDQHFVTMSFEQVGRECLMTPDGDVECYRLVGTIDLVVKEFKMTYWLSVDPPHRLVRYEGKRGLLLSPTFITTLESVSTPGDPPDEHPPPAEATAPR